jgi:transcription initiation factor TFIID subunit 5
MPLDEVTLASGTGLIPALNTIGPQTPPTQLKLGPAPMTDKLKEQQQRTEVKEANAQGHHNQMDTIRMEI